MVKKGKMTTPDILPGEAGWEELQAKKKLERVEKIREKRKSSGIEKAPLQIGKIVLGDKGYRFGRPTKTFKGETKYFIWRYKRKIGEVKINPDETIELEFFRLGGIGNYKHLIQDEDFRMQWMVREEELLMTQKDCYICKKKISKGAKPNLYHYNLFQKRANILEDAQKVPLDVVDGKLTVSQGWEKFNDILEEGNRYYMSLNETALVCAKCAKDKNLEAY